MNIENKVILITGANRGIGKALVEEALNRGAKRVYAGSRTALTHPDNRVVPLLLDITDSGQIIQAAAAVKELDMLINNAGVAYYDDLSDSEMLHKHLAVNLYGTLNLTQALVPVLKNSRGAVVNVLSILALAPFAPIASYCISKAAAFSMTQSTRAYLAAQNISVHAVLTGPVDTEMSRGLDVPKASPASVAINIFDGVENGSEDIFPDPMSAQLAGYWDNGAAKAMERQNAMAVQQ